MTKVKQPFCIHCNRHTGYRVNTRPVTVDVRGVYIAYQELFATCSKCSKEIYVDILNDMNCETRQWVYTKQISV